jgi:hypothetical protein
MKEEDYAEIKKDVEAAGFYTAFQPDGNGGLWIVLVTDRTDGRLHGNSFRVSFRSGRWYLITWWPVFYLVSGGADLTTLCLECLWASRSPVARVTSDIVSRHKLVEVSEEEYDRA